MAITHWILGGLLAGLLAAGEAGAAPTQPPLAVA